MNGRRVRFHLSVGILAAAIVAGVGGGGGGLAAMLGGRRALAASEDPREVKGRALFAQGEYQSALELFAALYAENRDPIYLRNIGRCHQKLRQPTKSIDAFEEYLRRSPRLKPSERQEVESFIKDMKELKAAQDASTPDATRPPPGGATAGGAGAGTTAGGGASSTLDVKPQPPPRSDPIVIDKPADAPAESRPLTKQWWFWAGVGGAAVITTVVTVLIISSGGVDRPPCETGFECL
jgi:hypothetical protein